MATKFASLKDNVSDLERFAWMREVATRLMWGSFAWNPPNVPGNTTVDTTLTTSTSEALTGLRTGMAVHVTPPLSLDAGLVVSAWVPADNQLTIRLGNVTAGAVNPVSATWVFSANLL